VHLRIALICVVALGLVPVAAAPASAAELSLEVTAPAGVRLGKPTALRGRATAAGAALAGRSVRLEVRPHPFDGPWRRRAHTVTAADGSFAFAPRLGRNHQVRARLAGIAPEPDTLSRQLQAYVLPAVTLAFSQRSRRVVRLRQTYRVPRDVRLSAPTRFYVGPCEPAADGRCTGRRAPFRKQVATVRVRAGRYLARATVRLPRSYGGRFQYVSCFTYSPGSGMGDPAQRCPRKFARLRR
jgi:hypothetical protein